MIVWLIAFITAKFLVRRHKYPKRILYWFAFLYYIWVARKMVIKSFKKAKKGLTN